MPDPYIPKNAGDLIRHGDWNEIQTRGRAELHGHGHTGQWQDDVFDGAPIARAGIADGAIDGTKIDPLSEVTARKLEITESAAIEALLVRADAVISGGLRVRGTMHIGAEDESDKMTYESGRLEIQAPKANIRLIAASTSSVPPSITLFNPESEHYKRTILIPRDNTLLSVEGYPELDSGEGKFVALTVGANGELFSPALRSEFVGADPWERSTASDTFQTVINHELTLNTNAHVAVIAFGHCRAPDRNGDHRIDVRVRIDQTNFRVNTSTSSDWVPMATPARTRLDKGVHRVKLQFRKVTAGGDPVHLNGASMLILITGS